MSPWVATERESASATPLGDITTIINQSPDTAKQAGQVMMQRCCHQKRQAGYHPCPTWWKTSGRPRALLDEKHQVVRNIELTTWHQADIWKQRGVFKASSPKAWMKHEMLFHWRCQYSKSFNIHLQCRRSTTTLRFLAQPNSNKINQAQKESQSNARRKPNQKQAHGESWKAPTQKSRSKAMLEGWTRNWSWLKRQSSQKCGAQRATEGTRKFPWPPQYIYFKFRKSKFSEISEIWNFGNSEFRNYI